MGAIPELPAATITHRWHMGLVRAVALSPDGNLLAVAVAYGLKDGPGEVRLYSVRSFELLAILKGHSCGVTCLAFTPDGKVLVSGGRDNKCVLWDMATRKPAGVLEGHTDDVWDLSVHPDGRHLASCGSDKTVVLWDLRTRRKIATLPTQGKMIGPIVHSPDGKLLAGGDGNGTIHVWDVRARKEVTNWKAHDGAVTGLVFDPDGSRLASCSEDGDLMVWGTKHWLNVGIYKLGNECHSLAISPNGKTLAVGLNASLVFVDISRNAVMMRWRLRDDVSPSQVTGDLVPTSVTFDVHDAAIMGVAFSRDGKMPVSGSLDETVKLWTNLPYQAEQRNDRDKGKR